MDDEEKETERLRYRIEPGQLLSHVFFREFEKDGVKAGFGPIAAVADAVDRTAVRVTAAVRTIGIGG